MVKCKDAMYVAFIANPMCNTTVICDKKNGMYVLLCSLYKHRIELAAGAAREI